MMLSSLISSFTGMFKKPDPMPTIQIAIPTKPTLAWGNKVSAQFRTLVFAIASNLGIEPDYLMACMAFESGRTFSASVKNAAGSGATGLIQFMPTTAKGMGTTVEALAAMTPEEQLDWVGVYFRPYKGRCKTLSDAYMAILMPSYIGKPEDSILFSGGISYRQNSGLDANSDGHVTKAEAAAHVQTMLDLGRQPQNLWVQA
jgi:hypothetical protein